MMIAPNSRARKGEKEKGGEEGVWRNLRGGEEEGNADYGGMVQPSQQYVAPYVNGIEWGLGIITLNNFALCHQLNITDDWRDTMPN